MAGEVDETLGSLFIGVVMSSMLWAGASVQAYNFFHYRHCSLRWKYIIGFVLVLETVYVILFLNDFKTHLIDHFGDTVLSKMLARSLPAQMIIQELAVSVTQSIIAYRLFCFHERSMVVAVPLFILILVHLVTGIAYALQITTIATYGGIRSLTVIPIIYAVFATAAGLILSGLLVSLLHRSRNSLNVRDNDPMASHNGGLAQHLSDLLFTSGVVPTCFSLSFCASLATFVHGAHSWIFTALSAASGLLWFNNLLACFNSRADDFGTTEPPLSANPFAAKKHEKSPPESSKASAIDLSDRDDIQVHAVKNSDAVVERSRPVLGVVTDIEACGATAYQTKGTEHPAPTRASSSRPPTPPEKDTHLTRRLSRALSRTFRKSISITRAPSAPTRPQNLPRRPSAAASTLPLSLSERRELGPPLSPPPGEPLPPLPLPIAISVAHTPLNFSQAPIAERFTRVPPPSVISPGDLPLSNGAAGPELVSIVPRKYGSLQINTEHLADEEIDVHPAVPLEIQRSRIPPPPSTRGSAPALTMLRPVRPQPVPDMTSALPAYGHREDTRRPLRALPVPPPLARSMST